MDCLAPKQPTALHDHKELRHGTGFVIGAPLVQQSSDGSAGKGSLIGKEGVDYGGNLLITLQYADLPRAEQRMRLLMEETFSYNLKNQLK